MKQVKVLMFALIVLMGVGFTSCLDGDDNSVVSRNFIVKAVNYGTTFQDASGMLLKPTASSLVLEGNMYSIYCQYDQNLITTESKSVDITLLDEPIRIDGEWVRDIPVVADAPLYSLEDNTLWLFDKQTLIVPVFYWAKRESTSEAQDKELAKHHFILSYNRELMTENSTELELTLSHQVDDAEGEEVVRADRAAEYKSFDLASALSAFQSKTGQKPTKIVVNTVVNFNKNSLDKEKDYARDASVKISYDFKD